MCLNMQVMSILPIFVLILIPFTTAKEYELSNWGSATKLRKSLLENYDPKVRPVLHHNVNTTVEVAIDIKSLDLDDQNQKLTVVLWLFVAWEDVFLTWNPQSNGKIKKMTFDAGEIWRPDLALYNSANDVNHALKTEFPSIVYNLGHVIHGSPLVAVVPCELDLYYWPTDEHTCTLQFGSLIHYGEQIDLDLGRWLNQTISIDDYHSNTEWLLLNRSASRETMVENGVTYIKIDFKLTLKRSTPAHAVYLANTTVAVMILVLIAYVLPLNHHLSRILLHLFSIGILISSNFALYISLPATAGRVPNIVSYYSGSTILTIMSLICTVVMTTTLTSSYGPRKGFRKKIASIWAGRAEEALPTPVTNEVPYGMLNDFESEMEVDQHPAESRTKTAEDLWASSIYGSTVVHRIVNGVLFALFFLAYLIDYSVLRRTIYGSQ